MAGSGDVVFMDAMRTNERTFPDGNVWLDASCTDATIGNEQCGTSHTWNRGTENRQPTVKLLIM